MINVSRKHIGIMLKHLMHLVLYKHPRQQGIFRSCYCDMIAQTLHNPNLWTY